MQGTSRDPGNLTEGSTAHGVVSVHRQSRTSLFGHRGPMGFDEASPEQAADRPRSTMRKHAMIQSDWGTKPYTELRRKQHQQTAGERHQVPQRSSW